MHKIHTKKQDWGTRLCRFGYHYVLSLEDGANSYRLDWCGYLLRSKSLIPMMILVYVIEYFGRAAAHLYTPGLVTENTPPRVVADYVLLPLAIMTFLIAVNTSQKAMNKR